MENKKVYFTKSKVELMGVKNALESEGIDFFEVDKSDSSYAGLFGHYEILVNEEDVEKAKKIIDKFEAN